MTTAAVPDGRLLVLHSSAGRVALAATILASSAASLDATVANVALPAIGAEFGGDVAALQWVVTGYMLTLASFILLGGALGDRYGRLRIFRIGAAWFALSSLACAVAPNLELLVAARVLQGVGGALLTPTALALTQSSFVRDDRAPAVGAWSGLGGIAGAIGPLLGGWLVDGPGWRWAFAINVPVIAMSLVASRAVPDDLPSTAPNGVRNFDLAGAFLAVVALAGLTWALTQGPERGWSDPGTLAPLGLSVVCSIGFVLRERSAAKPLLPGRLFASRTFTVLNIATFALYATLSVQFFLLAYQLQVGSGWSALAAGSALLPATVLVLIGSERSGALAARIGPRLQLTVGPLLVTAAVLLLSRIDESANWAIDVLPGSILFGLGLVCVVAPLTASVMGSVHEDEVSTASGVNNAIARTGGLVAIATIPALAGLSTATGPTETTEAFQTGMWIAAGCAVVASLVAVIGLESNVRPRSTARKYHCAVDGAPLQPDIAAPHAAGASSDAA